MILFLFILKTCPVNGQSIIPSGAGYDDTTAPSSVTEVASFSYGKLETEAITM